MFPIYAAHASQMHPFCMQRPQFPDTLFIMGNKWRPCLRRGEVFFFFVILLSIHTNTFVVITWDLSIHARIHTKYVQFKLTPDNSNKVLLDRSFSQEMELNA